MDSLCQIVLVGSRRRLHPHSSLSLPVQRSCRVEARAPPKGVDWCKVLSSMVDMGMRMIISGKCCYGVVSLCSVILRSGFLVQTHFFLLPAFYHDRYDSLGNALPHLPSSFCDEAFYKRSLTSMTGSAHEMSCHFFRHSLSIYTDSFTFNIEDMASYNEPLTEMIQQSEWWSIMLVWMSCNHNERIPSCP